MKSRGFTLLETLVVLAVFGLLMLALQFGLRAVLDMVGHQDRTRIFVSEFETADRTIRLMIEQIDPNEGGALAGTDRVMRVATSLPGVPAVRAALHVYEGRRLSLRWTASPHVWLAAAPVARETPLLDGIARIEIAYAILDNAGLHWVSRWDQNGLPALIRVRLIPTGGPHIWPDIVAVPRLGSGT